MAITTRNVYCRVFLQDGAPLAGAVIEAKLEQSDIDATGNVVPTWSAATTDVNGEAVLALWPNALGQYGTYYKVRVHDAAGNLQLSFNISVPDQDCFLEDVIVDDDAGAVRTVADWTIAPAPSDLLTLLKLVDGAGSGLDADLLDGLEGAAYALADGTRAFTGNVLIKTNADPRLTLEEASGSPLIVADINDSVGRLQKRAASGEALLELDATPMDGVSRSLVRVGGQTDTTGAVRFLVLAGDGTAFTNHDLDGKGNALLCQDVGNVGIGTSSPAAKLDVAVPGIGAVLRLRREDIDAQAVFDFDANDFTIDLNDIDFAIDQSGVEQFRVSVAGNVGIGTPNPARKLHINGVMRLEPTTEPTSPSAGDIYFDSTTNKLRCYDGTTWNNLF